MAKDLFKISTKKFKSRLIVGTGKYKNFVECSKAVKASGADIVTVAVRRVNISDKKKPMLMDYLDPKKITYLPNTAGCFSSDEALRTLRLAREIGGWKLVKLEVLGDKKSLLPDMIETLKSTEVLSKEGFKVMVYCNDDPLMAKRLENVGAVAIMPLAAPIGSGLGIQNFTNIKIIRKQTKLPLIIDAGIGEASDAAIALELGCDGVLINTAIAQAKKPTEMAIAMKYAVIAGRKSFLSGRIKKSLMDLLQLLKKELFNFSSFVIFFFLKSCFMNFITLLLLLFLLSMNFLISTLCSIFSKIFLLLFSNKISYSGTSKNLSPKILIFILYFFSKYLRSF